MAGAAWCKSTHKRTGIVSNQSREAFDTSRSLASVTTCSAEACIEKAVSYVAGATNETATFQPDEVKS